MKWQAEKWDYSIYLSMRIKIWDKISATHKLQPLFGKFELILVNKETGTGWLLNNSKGLDGNNGSNCA